MTFGLITEGPTDQVVLRYLLARYFSDPDIDTRPVQPNTDSTDKEDHFGGWKNVLNHCSSADMTAALQGYDYVIIQIDTDCCEDYGVPKRVGGKDITDNEIVQKTKELIIENIGADLYAKYSSKIIFAISHSSIECWLLPFYFANNQRKKTVNCCETLNQELNRDGFNLDCNNKKEKYYHKICKKIRSKAQIESESVHNDSFNLFISRLTSI